MLLEIICSHFMKDTHIYYFYSFIRQNMQLSVYDFMDVLRQLFAYMSRSDYTQPEGGPFLRTLAYNYFGGNAHALCENVLPGNFP